VLWCLKSLSTIFQLCRGVQFYWWRKPEYPEKTTHRLTCLSGSIIFEIVFFSVYITIYNMRFQGYFYQFIGSGIKCLAPLSTIYKLLLVL
jgi:hypothetical protein